LPRRLLLQRLVALTLLWLVRQLQRRRLQRRRMVALTLLPSRLLLLLLAMHGALRGRPHVWLMS
jgi:hypothetical protein